MLRWHIDYLTTHNNAAIEKILFKHSNQKEECKIAKRIAHNGIPVPRFGSSDCKCQSHLYRIDDVEQMEWEKMGMREYERVSPR